MPKKKAAKKAASKKKVKVTYRFRDAKTGGFISAKRASQLSPKRVVRERIEQTTISGGHC